ncbi:MAG TPA: cytochrome P450 [Candidatus Dormibacteraeota bacterium]|nr:cytochrome P450 [Candidatus Dormibacteraeota bacterium]
MRGLLPPGPPLPTWVQTALWLARPVGFPVWAARRYGDPHRLRLSFSGELVLTADPALVPTVLGLRPEMASAGEANALLAPLLGTRSLLMLDGAEHLRLRQLLGPSFRGEAMRRHQAAIVDLTLREVARWPRGTPFPLLPRMRALTLEVILQVVFGLEAGPRLDLLRRLLTELLAMGSSWMVLPGTRRDLGPRSPWGRFLRHKAQVDALLEEEIKERRRSGPDRGLLADLLADETHDLDLQGLRDQLLTLLVAGHETTATTLAWCFELLLRHPEAMERARVDDRYLEAVVQETLRLRPIFRMTSRRLRRDLELGPYRLPPGVSVGAAIYLTHHRSDLYPDPERFRPERFLGVAPEPGAWIPFGGGIRRCLGAAFASFEMALVVRTVLTSIHLRPASDRPEPISLHAVVLVPGRGTRVVAEHGPAG